MKYTVVMPSLGADMNEGKFVSWKMKVGDKIKKGDSIALVETTKSVVEIESFREGVVLELVAHEGEILPVGATLAYLEVEKEKVHFGGVNLRRAISDSMARSKREIPHYYLKTQINLDPYLEWLDKKNKDTPQDKRWIFPLGPLRAVILSLKKVPQLNGVVEKGEFISSSAINLGVVVSQKEGGVLAPAILEAQKLSLFELNEALIALVERSRKGELKNSELTLGTCSITNLGDQGADEVYGIIFPPQVAMVGLGRLKKSPIVQGDALKVGWGMSVTLSADHRVTDGLTGGRFLWEVEKFLTTPALLEESHEIK